MQLTRTKEKLNAINIAQVKRSNNYNSRMRRNIVRDNAIFRFDFLTCIKSFFSKCFSMCL